MQKHEIPRESKNEGKILYFFNGRSILTTLIGMAIGFMIGYILNNFIPTIGMIIGLGLFGAIGFMVGTVKIPEIISLPITKSISGMYIDEAIVKYIKFKKRRSLKILKEED